MARHNMELYEMNKNCIFASMEQDIEHMEEKHKNMRKGGYTWLGALLGTDSEPED